MINRRVNAGLIDEHHTKQILGFATAVIDGLPEKGTLNRHCWGLRLGNDAVYGSLVRPKGIEYLAWRGVNYLQGRVFLLEQKIIKQDKGQINGKE